MLWVILLLAACEVALLSAFFLLLYLASLVTSPKPLLLPAAHVVVTGSSCGTGKRIVVECFKQGAFITLLAKNESQLLEAKKEIEKICTLDKQVVHCISVDVFKDYANVEQVVKQAQDKLGPVDMLVNSAGTLVTGKFEDLDTKNFEELISVNYLGGVYPTHAVITTMKERRMGRIVFVSSQAGQLGLFGYTAYSATKFALRGLAEALQMEVKPYNVYITVAFLPNTDTPGFAEESKTKLLETRLISEASPVCKPDHVARIIVKSIQGKFGSSVRNTADGHMLNVITSGMSPMNFLGEALEAEICNGFFHLGHYYIASFDSIVCGCMIQVFTLSTEKRKTSWQSRTKGESIHSPASVSSKRIKKVVEERRSSREVVSFEATNPVDLDPSLRCGPGGPGSSFIGNWRSTH
ncbi:PREDICTED: 3-ketodihydrosphingosine reductase-like [Gekko japonicus]|uniref:3-dehydrosphinganine reductase n=1 Tax=Gekko japonicus TaxID=146911 RepID=A0ABM1KH83_GEKJA|nr:PREDICTED: 3-ketodihydrosphingosine reductase-like [Gekko japonicus]